MLLFISVLNEQVNNRTTEQIKGQTNEQTNESVIYLQRAHAIHVKPFSLSNEDVT